MNARHAQFVQEYLVDLNATQAYRRVYPRSSVSAAGRDSHKLLKKPEIAAAIAAGQKARLEESKVTAAWVIERLRIEATNNGENATHTGRVRALELLGKHLAIFVERLKLEGEVKTSPSPNLNLSSLTDGQLHQMRDLLKAAKGAAPIAQPDPAAG